MVTIKYGFDPESIEMFEYETDLTDFKKSMSKLQLLDYAKDVYEKTDASLQNEINAAYDITGLDDFVETNSGALEFASDVVFDASADDNDFFKFYEDEITEFYRKAAMREFSGND